MTAGEWVAVALLAVLGLSNVPGALGHLDVDSPRAAAIMAGFLLGLAGVILVNGLTR